MSQLDICAAGEMHSHMHIIHSHVMHLSLVYRAQAAGIPISSVYLNGHMIHR